MRILLKRILRNPWVEWEPHPVTGKRGPSDKQAELAVWQEGPFKQITMLLEIEAE